MLTRSLAGLSTAVDMKTTGGDFEQIFSNESSFLPISESAEYMNEKITGNLNEHIDKLLADLEFIEKPLVGKRIRKTKKQIAEK